MPYPGIKDPKVTRKLDRCVKQVMAENPSWSKSRAIATCRKAMKKSEGVMPKTKNGKTARQRRKEDRRRLAQAQQLADDPTADTKAEELEFDDTVPFEEWEKYNQIPDEELIEEMPEEDEKHMYASEAQIIDLTPPTDFEELDEERDAEERASKMRQVGWDADRLLGNIVHSPVMEPNEKEEKIVKVGKEYAKRLTNIVQDNGEKEIEKWEPEEKDMEEAEAEMWASFVDVGWLDKLFIKAKLTSAARNALPDSKFACIRDGKRHLPIHDKAHVRNALARLPQMIKRGGESASIARCGRAKVLAAAKRMGIGKAGKDNLNGILVEKDAEGTYRWIGWVSNNFRDREGEIISEAAHKEFVSYLDAHPEQAPEFWTWHTRGTARQSKADAWLYHKGFLIMSGAMTDIEAYRLMKEISSEDIGMSHGFFGLKDPNDKTIITKYRAYEVSELPLSRAANPWTGIEAKLKEVSSMNDRLDFLKKYAGEDFVAGLLDQAEENKDFLDELGIESKDVDELDPETVETEEETTEEEGKELTKRQEKFVEETFGMPSAELKEIVQAAKVVPAMAKRIINLEKQVEGFEETKEDALADMIGGTAAAKAKTLANRPSAQEDNTMTEKEMEDFIPPQANPKGDDNWLSEITNTEPVYEEAE